MAATMIEQDELGPLFDLSALYEADAYELVTCRYSYGEDVSVQLTYAQEHTGNPQTGHMVSPAATALCEYLEKHRDEIPDGTIVELGAGCGLTGLAIAQLRPDATVVFTDHDPGVLKTIDHNCTKQERKQARCISQRLRWGADGATEVDALEAQLGKRQQVDMIVASDVIYSSESVAWLFWTVDRLLKTTPGGSFLMCSSQRYNDATEAEIDAQCALFGLERKILSCSLSDQRGGSRVQRFVRKSTI